MPTLIKPSPEAEAEAYYTTAEFAKLLGVHLSTVHRWTRSGAVDSLRIKGTLRIPASEVAKHTTPAAERAS